MSLLGPRRPDRATVSRAGVQQLQGQRTEHGGYPVEGATVDAWSLELIVRHAVCCCQPLLRLNDRAMRQRGASRHPHHSARWSSVSSSAGPALQVETPTPTFLSHRPPLLRSEAVGHRHREVQVRVAAREVDRVLAFT